MSIIVFILGLIIGSFLNVCIYRIPREESIAFPPSHCTNCGTSLKGWDLIPVFSWVFLGGTCRYCKSKISIRYPFIEVLTGILYLFTYLKYGLNYNLILGLVFVSILVVVTFTDFDHQIIPNSVNLFGAVFFITFNLIFKHIDWKDSLLGLLIGAGVLFVIVLLTGGAGMGMGDVKLLGVLGLFFGWKLTILTLFLSFIIGGVIGTFLLITKIKGRKDAIPFGPWIAMAALITNFYGEQMIAWYLNFL